MLEVGIRKRGMDPDRKGIAAAKGCSIHFAPGPGGLYVTFHRHDERRQYGKPEIK